MDIFILELIAENDRLKRLLDRAVIDLATRDGITIDAARNKLGASLDDTNSSI